MIAMKRKIILGIILVTILFISCGLIYVNKVFLPYKLKARLIHQIKSVLNNKEVYIGRLRYNLWRGLCIEELLISDNTEKAPKEIIRAKEISLQILPLPLLKKVMIIPFINIEDLHLNLVYQENKTFNLQELFLPGDGRKTNLFFIISALRIHNAGISFTDKNTLPEFQQEMSNLDIKANLWINKEIRFLAKAKLKQKNYPEASINLAGTYSLAEKTTYAKLKLHSLFLNCYHAYLKNLALNLSSDKPLEIETVVLLKNGMLNLGAEIHGKEVLLEKEKYRLRADFQLEPNLKYDISTKTWDYQGKIKLNQGQVSGIDYLKDLKDIFLEVYFFPDLLNLKGQFQALNTKFKIDGRIKDFTSFFLDLSIRAEQMNLENFLIPAQGKMPKDISASGSLALELNIQGPFSQPDIRAKLYLKEAKIKLPFLQQDLEQIKGRINFTTNSIDWQDLSFFYAKEKFNTQGSLVDFRHPEINFNLSSEELRLNSVLKILDSAIKITKFKANLKQATLEAKADIDISQRDNPKLDTSFNLKFNPKDIADRLPARFSEIIKQARLEGVCDISGYLNAQERSWRNWDISLKIASGLLSIYGLKFENLFLNLRQVNQLLKVIQAQADFYHGKVNLELAANLEPQELPYKLEAELKNVDLAKLKNDIAQIIQQDISGLLDGQISAKGNLKEIKKSKALGSLIIRDGRLWELNLLKGLGEFLFLPSFRKVIFKEGYAEFLIEEEVIYTEKIVLKGEELNLFCSGTIGLDKRLNLKLTTEINPQLIAESKDPRRFTTLLTSNYLLISIDGTLDKPRYHLSAVPLEAIKSIKDFFLYKQR